MFYSSRGDCAGKHKLTVNLQGLIYSCERPFTGYVKDFSLRTSIKDFSLQVPLKDLSLRASLLFPASYRQQDTAGLQVGRDPHSFAAQPAAGDFPQPTAIS